MFVILFEIYFLLVFFENSQRFSNLQKEIHILKTACNEVQDNKKLVCLCCFNCCFFLIKILDFIIGIGFGFGQLYQWFNFSWRRIWLQIDIFAKDARSETK